MESQKYREEGALGISIFCGHFSPHDCNFYFFVNVFVCMTMSSACSGESEIQGGGTSKIVISIFCGRFSLVSLGLSSGESVDQWKNLTIGALLPPPNIT